MSGKITQGTGHTSVAQENLIEKVAKATSRFELFAC